MKRIIYGLFIFLVLFVFSFSGCSKSDEEFAKEKFELALKYKTAEKYFRAAEVFEDIELLYPEYSEMENVKSEKKECLIKGNFEKAKSLIYQNKADKAIEYIQRTLELDPDDIESNYTVGFLYFQMAFNYIMMMQTPGMSYEEMGYLSSQSDSLIELSKIWFDKCIEMNDKHYAGHKGLGHYYLVKGDGEKAVEEMKLAIKYAPDEERKAVCKDALAQIYMNGGNLEAALNTIEDTLEEYPKRGDTYLTYANILYSRGKIDKAIEEIQVGLDLRFDQPSTKHQLYATLSLLYSEKGDYESAKDAILNAIKLDIGNQEYLDQFAYLQSLTTESE